MNHTAFVEKAKQLVAEYSNDHSDASDPKRSVLDAEDVYVVWSAKVLQNSKVLLSTPLPDGMYYEVTLNGDKDQIYFDAYKKFQNMMVEV